MWNISDTLDVITEMYGGLGTILLLTIGSIVTSLVALLGLGFAVSKLTEYIYGKPRGHDSRGNAIW